VYRAAIFVATIAVLLGVPSLAAAETIGVVTIQEGDAIAIRGLSEFALAEGVRIQSNDLLETGKATFLRVEFSDGAMVDLGPATRAQLNRPSLRKYDRPALYLLSGMMKINAGKLAAGAKASVASPQFDAVGLDSESVEQVQNGASAVFAQDGPVRMLDRRRGTPVQIQVKSGDFIVLRNLEAPKVSGRPAHEFVGALPRQFEDSIPPRIDRFKAKEVPAKLAGAFTYAQVEDWLDAEPIIRRRFVSEWAAKADDEVFRERLEARLARHPEWERLLYPERFEPKPAAPAAAPAAASVASPVASVPPAAGGSGPSNTSVLPATPERGAREGAPAH
jgi:hypothetical protein